jgi:hypothetical protein
MSYLLDPTQRPNLGTILFNDPTPSLSIDDGLWPLNNSDIFVMDTPWPNSRFINLGDSTSNPNCPDILVSAIYQQEVTPPWMLLPGSKYTLLYYIAGITKDSGGAPLGGCEVDLFRSSDDLKVDTITSDAAGNYRVYTPFTTEYHYCTAYNTSGSVAGMTAKTLLPSAP